jgi:hypothetical protein
MEDREFVYKGTVIRYLDEGPLEFRKNFVIYSKIADAVIFNEYEASIPHSGCVTNHSMRRNASYMPTKGKQSRVREIENALKRECRVKGKNLIELSYPDVQAELEAIRMHIEKVFGRPVRKRYVFAGADSPLD